jgi:hypothetical protein
MRSVHLRIIGDVHGRILDRVRRADRDMDRRCMPAIWRDPRLRGRSYLRLAKEAKHSIQVGDLALDYSDLGTLDPEYHRVVAGNHDRLPNLSPHFLGDFGTHSVPLAEGRLELFFARGAASIDRMARIEGLNWWPEEELDSQQQASAIASYGAARPRLVVTHDCPTELVGMIATQGQKLPASQTNAMLQAMFESHVPQWWFFGHHHRNWVFQHPRGTRFVCLGSLAYFDFDETGRSISWKPE